jgi:hypothetical protein
VPGAVAPTLMSVVKVRLPPDGSAARSGRAEDPTADLLERVSRPAFATAPESCSGSGVLGVKRDGSGADTPG